MQFYGQKNRLFNYFVCGYKIIKSIDNH